MSIVQLTEFLISEKCVLPMVIVRRESKVRIQLDLSGTSECVEGGAKTISAVRFSIAFRIAALWHLSSSMVDFTATFRVKASEMRHLISQRQVSGLQSISSLSFTYLHLELRKILNTRINQEQTILPFVSADLNILIVWHWAAASKSLV